MSLVGQRLLPPEEVERLGLYKEEVLECQPGNYWSAASERLQLM